MQSKNSGSPCCCTHRRPYIPPTNYPIYFNACFYNSYILLCGARDSRISFPFYDDRGSADGVRFPGDKSTVYGGRLRSVVSNMRILLCHIASSCTHCIHGSLSGFVRLIVGLNKITGTLKLYAHIYLSRMLKKNQLIYIFNTSCMMILTILPN